MNNNNNKTNETLNLILTQLSSINSRVKNLERRIVMGKMFESLKLLEQHAKECTDFKEFTMHTQQIQPTTETNRGSLSFYGIISTQPTISIICNCAQPNGHIIICDDNKTIIPIIQEFIDELKIKYQKPDKPQIITNITSRLEI